MTDKILLPSGVIDALRDGLRGQLATSAQEVTYADEVAGGREDPKRYLEPLRCMDALRALLDEIGWTGQPIDLQVDLQIHRCALLLALQDQVSVHNDLLHEGDRGNQPREFTAHSMNALATLALIVLLRIQVQILRTTKRQTRHSGEAYAGPFW